MMSNLQTTNQPGAVRPHRRLGAMAAGLLLTWALPALAQVAIPEQPDPAAWLRTVMAKRMAGLPTQQALLAMKPGPIPTSLAADLATFDWLLAGAYSYPEKTLGIAYKEPNPCQLDIARYQPDLGDLTFSYTANCADREHGQIVHTNFTIPSPTRTTVKALAGGTYLQMIAYGEAEFHQVVSYRNGVLVVDISYDGKPRSRTVKFRDVRIAVPRGFRWVPAK